jgi:hypothetical protein
MHRSPKLDRDRPVLVQSCIAVVVAPRNLTLLAGVKSIRISENLSKFTAGRSQHEFFRKRVASCVSETILGVQEMVVFLNFLDDLGLSGF